MFTMENGTITETIIKMQTNNNDNDNNDKIKESFSPHKENIC